MAAKVGNGSEGDNQEKTEKGREVEEGPIKKLWKKMILIFENI